MDDHDALLREAVEALQKAEDLLASIDRSRVMRHLDELRDQIEKVPQVQLDLRITRLRISAKLQSDPDKTPSRSISVHAMKAVRDDE